MHHRTALFGILTAWAGLWAALGLMRLSDFHSPFLATGMDQAALRMIAFVDGPAGDARAAAQGLRLLGLLQLGVAALFLAALLPRRRDLQGDAVLRACGYAMIALGLTTALDSLADEVGSMLFDAAIFAALAATAFYASVLDKVMLRHDDNVLFTWTQREAMLDETVERLARRRVLVDYQEPCRTSLPTSGASG